MFKLFFSILLLVVLSCPLFSQNARLLDLDNERAYRLIELIKERGHLQNLNPVKLPYAVQQVNNGLDDISTDDLSELEREWVNQLKEEVAFSEEELAKEYLIEPYLLNATEINNTDRKNVYRPRNNELFVWPFGEVGSFGDFGNFSLKANVHFDLYYEFGLDGIDPTNRLYIRNENAYVGYKSKYFSSYLGRIESSWGQFNRNSTFLTPNALPFDQFQYTVGTNIISFNSLNGILDNVDADGTYDGHTLGDRSNSKRRYLSLKSIDWKVNEHLFLSFKEGILYSGENVNMDARYMVPSFLFFFLEAATPRDQTENLFIGGSIWYNYNNITLYFDAMLDDLIRNRKERGVSEKNNFGIVANASYSFINKPIKLNLDSELFTYQVYNTDQADGRYLYLGRGIASQYNDYIFSELKLDYFMVNILKGLTLSPYFGILKQGEQVINQEFQSEYPNGRGYEYVLTGTVETTRRTGLEVYYSPVRFFRLKSDLGYNFVSNKNNVENASESRFSSMFEISFIFR
jgi:hypothetical protein